jgi:hypothetical protein
MQDEPLSDLEPKRIPIKKRSEEARLAYVQGYKAGLTAALHGVQRAIDHFDDLMISGAMEDGGNN